MIAEPELGMERFSTKLKSFDIEFLPFIEEINAKQEAIRGYADAATMERVRSKLSPFLFSLLTVGEKYDSTTWVGYHGAKSNASM